MNVNIESYLMFEVSVVNGSCCSNDDARFLCLEVFLSTSPNGNFIGRTTMALQSPDHYQNLSMDEIER